LLSFAFARDQEGKTKLACNNKHHLLYAPGLLGEGAGNMEQVAWVGRRQLYRHHQTLHFFSFSCLFCSAMSLIGFFLPIGDGWWWEKCYSVHIFASVLIEL
jgi:hypothetical protein